MYWGDLPFIIAVHRHGTFSAAAKALGVTHTTVARRIKGLERLYGSQLVDPARGGIALTAAGETVLETALRIEDQLLDLERVVSGNDTRLAGVLRLATCDAFAWLYADAFRSFGDRYPLIELEIIAGNEVLNLSRREADIAIRVTNTPQDSLVGRRINRLDHAVYGTHDMADRAKAGRHYVDLPWITYATRQPTRMIDAWMQDNLPNAKIAAQVDTTLIMLRAVQAGIGVAVLPTVLGDGCPSLERLSPLLPELRQDVWLLTPRELLTTARVRAFYDHMAGNRPRH
ncbi:LysR family transcriptional regulator [Zavarzinia compransoris]|uniref:LysR family transcriptional regulator n=1 Tax=Zavarzinia marina TaxID=2911065 RepID=UPI001F23498F|nr:LysR family transcriptional regulator [Zavarzinia marina]MCF4167304.1 LysR family transcriptional regulator [Zavarzinia marina]